MQDSVYRFGEFSISPADRRLFQGPTTLRIAPKTFDALLLLVRNHTRLITRDEILSALWPDVHVAESNLTNIIVQLRKLLGRDAIQTVSKHGYRFTLTVLGEPGVSQTMYASFARARELLNMRTIESIGAARDLFWVCLAENPDYAPAWAWLGRTCRLLEKFKGEVPACSLAEAAFHRAFLLDPDLACAHQFYTQFQVDTGRGAQAITRLANRIQKHGEEPETLAGLIQVLRVCGLLEESIAAHGRAIALDPAVKTSVAHTHFLNCDYTKVFETYNATQFYLDAAAWAALGNHERAISSLRPRLQRSELGPVMSSMMASLLAVLEGRNDEAIALMQNVPFFQEPEGRFYLARHCGMLNAVELTVNLIRQARSEGFYSPITLQQDPAFAGIRSEPAFLQELGEAKRLTAQARANEMIRRILPGPSGPPPR